MARKRDLPKTDETGQVYGRLTVLGFAGWKVEQTQRRQLWDCVCECGQKVVMRGQSLRAGVSQSCGCLNVERTRKALRKPVGTSAINAVYAKYRYEAKARGYEFALSKAEFRDITNGPCHYCNVQPVPRVVRSCYNGVFVGNGIDRMDNARGYEPENCVPCCEACNTAKSDRTYAEFIRWIGAVYSHLYVNKWIARSAVS